jgi:hypothetical protein
MAMVPAVTVEEVHQRAREDEEIGQRSVEMSPVLGQEEERRDAEEPEQDEPGSTLPPRRLGMVVHGAAPWLDDVPTDHPESGPMASLT